MSELKYRLIIILCSAWRRRYMIVIPILILPIVGFIIGKLAPTKYHAHTSMLIQETAKMNPFLEDIAVSTMLKDRLNALRTLLKSRHVLKSVGVERKLITDDMTPQEVEHVIQKISSSITVSQAGKDFFKNRANIQQS